MEHAQPIMLQAGDYTARIDLAAGANCISLRNQKYNATILREPGEVIDNPYLYGMPILFPVNRIHTGTFSFEGRTYRFPVNEPATDCHLHGFIHASAFSVQDLQEDQIVCVFRSTEEFPYPGFPHAFEITMKYRLTEDGMLHEVCVTNLSETNMPVFLGFHTTFNTLFTPDSKEANIRVSAQLSEEYARNMQNYLPTGEKPAFDSVSSQLAHGEFNPHSQPISRHYRCAAPGNMVIYDSGSDLSIVYENDEKYKFRLIYNGNADGYICLEPQTCLANCPNAPVSREEAGFDSIAPGETKQYVSHIYLTGGEYK